MQTKHYSSFIKIIKNEWRISFDSLGSLLVYAFTYTFVHPENDIHPGIRKIFGGNVPFLPNEITKIKEFDQYVLKNRVILDDTFDDALKLRFLQSTGYSAEKAVKGAIGYVKWRQGMPRQIPSKIG